MNWRSIFATGTCALDDVPIFAVVNTSSNRHTSEKPPSGNKSAGFVNSQEDLSASLTASLVILIIIFFVLTTIVGRPLAATFRMSLVATAFPAIIAALLATALIPDRVSHYVQSFD